MGNKERGTNRFGEKGIATEQGDRSAAIPFLGKPDLLQQGLLFNKADKKLFAAQSRGGT